MKRTVTLKRRPRAKGADPIERELWRENLGRCVLYGVTACEGKVRGHHIIEKRTLRREGLTEYVWDRRNRLGLCDRHHARHHSGLERVPWRFLSDAAFDFAEEVGLGYLIDRYYPEAA